MNDTLKGQFSFDEASRSKWILKISEIYNSLKRNYDSGFIALFFKCSINENVFEPFHIVTLSCLIDEIKNRGYKVSLNFECGHLNQVLFEEINIKKYWGEDRVSYIKSPKITDLNIWRIVDSEKETYSISIHDYFKRHYFKEYDLSALKNTLNELYCNVFDHADAKGTAFSYIRYDEANKKIKIAICDFGKGIAKSLREKYPDYTTDAIALEKSIEIGVSARTQTHNRGFGLDNVVSTLSKDNVLRILSNKALLAIKGNKETIEKFEIDFDFHGTLIYFDISIDSFEKEEIITDFSFD